MTLSIFRQLFLEKLTPLYGVDEAQAIFKVLLADHLGLEPVDLVLQRDKKLTVPEISQLTESLERLHQEEPVQYVIGETEFYGLPFKVNPDVLIPRPETEELVAWILESITSLNHVTEDSIPLTILDIGTGSGCIAISLAKNLPKVKVYAIDVSPKALAIAKNNARLNKVAIEFIEKDILAITELPEVFDVIVSNPPYVRELEKSEMHKNVLDHEPSLALYVSDEDPLVFYRKITELANENLSPKGLLFFEINQYLGQEMQQLLVQNSFQDIALRKDIFGVDRMLKGTQRT